jgi:hypothetical protein
MLQIGISSLEYGTLRRYQFGAVRSRHSPQSLNQTLDLLFPNIKMRRNPHPALSRRRNETLSLQIPHNHPAIHIGLPETHNPGTGLRRA